MMRPLCTLFVLVTVQAQQPASSGSCLEASESCEEMDSDLVAMLQAKLTTSEQETQPSGSELEEVKEEKREYNGKTSPAVLETILTSPTEASTLTLADAGFAPVPTPAAAPQQELIEAQISQYIFAADGSLTCPSGYEPIDDLKICQGGLSVSGVDYSWNVAFDDLCWPGDRWPGTGCFAYGTTLYFSTCGDQPLTRYSHNGICKKKVCRDLSGHYTVTGPWVGVTTLTQNGCSGIIGGTWKYHMSGSQVTMDAGPTGAIAQNPWWNHDSLTITWNNGYTYTRSPGGSLFGQYELGAQNPQYAKLVLLTEAATQSNAKCLDGSPAGYYFRAGTGDGMNKWYIHHEGGAWCTSLDECLERSKGRLGSSTTYPAQANLGGGYFSQEPEVNPMMHNWNSVYLKYCDGGSFTGLKDSATMVGNVALHFRGKAILTAMQQDLLKKGLDAASDVVISGCSAGGLSAFLHADSWAELLKPQGAKVVSMPDSGFFLDEHSLAPGMKWVFENMDSTSGVNQKCIDAARLTGDSWKCMFAQHTAPHITTPTFLLQGEYDNYQTIYNLQSYNDTKINLFGQSVTTLVENQLLGMNAKHGTFLDSCAHHCGGWGKYHMDGKTAPVAFQEWYEGGSQSLSNGGYYAQKQTFPCKDCCEASGR